MTLNTRRFAATAALLTAALFTTGCSALSNTINAAPAPSDAEVTLESFSAPAPEPLWTTDAQKVGNSFEIVDDTVVSHIFRDGQLTLVGYDLQTGAEKWAHAGSTGSQLKDTAVNPRVFTAEDGSAVALHLLDPVKEVFSENNTFQYRHPVQIVDVATGEVRAETNELTWLSNDAATCITDNTHCIQGVFTPGGTFETVAVNDKGEAISSPNDSVLADIKFVSRTAPNGLFDGMLLDGTPVIGLATNNEINWVTSYEELGFPIPTVNEQNDGFYGSILKGTWHESDDVVIIGGGNTDATEDTDSVFNHVSTAVKISTGEVLWSAKAHNCHTGVLCAGETKIAKDNGGYIYLPSDLTLRGYDPVTGEETWATEAAGMELSKAGSLQSPDDSIAVLHLADGISLLNTADGSITQPTAEQSFTCAADGATYKLPESSLPDNPPVDWSNNAVTAACTAGSDDRVTDPATFTEAVVSGASPIPYAADKDWRNLDDQIRVIATENGFAAYKF